MDKAAQESRAGAQAFLDQMNAMIDEELERWDPADLGHDLLMEFLKFEKEFLQKVFDYGQNKPHPMVFDLMDRFIGHWPHLIQVMTMLNPNNMKTRVVADEDTPSTP